MHVVHFCTPDDALVGRNILSFYITILSQFVKPTSDLSLLFQDVSPSNITIISKIEINLRFVKLN
jgi:hypothetical protein